MEITSIRDFSVLLAVGEGLDPPGYPKDNIATGNR